MVDPETLSRALRASIALRDKLVIVRAQGAAFAGPALLDALAQDLGLLRAVGARVSVVCPDGAAAEALSAALVRAGERAAPLAGASLVKLAIPGGLPVVEGLLLSQLGALGWVPVVAAPAPGAAVAVGVDLLTAALAVMGGAERLVFLGGPPEGTTATLLGAMGRAYIAAEGSLIAALLLGDARAPLDGAQAPVASSPAPSVITGAGASMLLGAKASLPAAEAPAREEETPSRPSRLKALA